jgi:16S rRNA A1518/A1519 N6-dimethyltransferase RsmA/KsgA/DIM1 with predicted DNA glycosylase/AP lyase activity
MKESLNSPDCPKMTQQTWNAQQYINHASFVPELAHPVLELLKPKSGETILDLGCGDGTLTLKAESLLKPVLYTEKEGWVADYVRLRFAASKVSTVNEM